MESNQSSPGGHEHPSKLPAGQHASGELFGAFVDLIEVLRSPDGCPWDREQTHQSIAKNMVEEAYEAVHAIELRDVHSIREELGDVLLQVVLQAQIAADAGEFTIADVVSDVHAKILRRHPHVFGPDGTAEDPAYAAVALDIGAVDQPAGAAETLNLWDTMKRAEKQESGKGLLDAIALSQPALALAQDMSRKMVGAGFEWDTLDQVIDQVIEEVREFVEAEPGSEHAAEELGDVLFTVVNVARKHGIDAESALRGACTKVRRRWREMERLAAEQNRNIASFTVDEQEAFWRQAKLTENGDAE